MKRVSFSKIIGSQGIFVDGDWVESKDQDPTGEVRLIQLADIGDGVFINKSKRYLTSEKARELKCTFLEPGDLLIARMPDPLGRACVFPKIEMPCVTVVDVCIVRPDKNIVFSEWLKLLVNSRGFRRRINKYITGTTRQRISRGNLEKLTFTIPSLEDQERIVKMFDQADALRQKRKQAINLLDDYLKSVFLEMFGDPVKNPKGWEVKELSELVSDDCPLTYGIVQPGDEYIDGTYVVRPVDLVSDYVGNKGLKRIDPAIDSRFKRTRLKGGELLMCVRGTTGVTSIARPELRGANVTRGITPIWFSEGYDSLFAFHQIRSESIQQSIQEKTYGIALQQINLKDVRVLKLIVPPISLQKKFAALATKVELIKQKMVVQSEELEHQFQSLMQKAFKRDL